MGGVCVHTKKCLYADFMSFTEIETNNLSFNPFSLIGNRWMLITSGNENKFNTMTASWGGVGFLWNKPVTFCFIRPQRYTFEFVENNDYYSLCFFPENMKKTLSFCGKNSGRDIDKIKETGLIGKFDCDAPYFQQAELVFICKKLYAQFLSPELFIEQSIKSTAYPQNDYHKAYIGEIVKGLKKDE